MKLLSHIPFLKGVLVGYLLKKDIDELIKEILSKIFNIIELFNKKPEKKNDFSVNVVIRIKNNELLNTLFNDSFPPYWDFYPKSNSINIGLPNLELNDIFKTQDCLSFSEFIELKDSENSYIVTLDIPLLMSIGDIYLYIDYTLNNKKYTNIYTPIDFIKLTDFTEPKKTINVLSASLKYNNNKTEYMTLHLNKFLRNNIKLTPELLLLHYEPLKNINLKQSKMYIITKIIKEYSYTEQLQLI
jgi:hypothetical protein